MKIKTKDQVRLEEAYEQVGGSIDLDTITNAFADEIKDMFTDYINDSDPSDDTFLRFLKQFKKLMIVLHQERNEGRTVTAATVKKVAAGLRLDPALVDNILGIVPSTAKPKPWNEA